MTIWRWTWVLSALAIVSGCAMTGKIPSLPQADAQSAAHPPLPPDAPQVTVEIHPTDGTPARQSIPWREGMVVQDALLQTGTVEQFKRMRLQVDRKLPGGQRHKLSANYIPGRRRVSPDTDYALFPNDRIVALEDSSSMLDDMFSGLAPFGTGK